MTNVYLQGTITIPSALEITAITNSNPIVITISAQATLQANTYIVGQNVRLLIPWAYGMWQANGLEANIIKISGSDFTLDADSTFFDVFNVPISPKALQPASMGPNGSRNLQYSNLTNQVAFQALNNIGN